jgi:hypothetical protein
MIALHKVRLHSIAVVVVCLTSNVAGPGYTNRHRRQRIDHIFATNGPGLKTQSVDAGSGSNPDEGTELHQAVKPQRREEDSAREVSLNVSPQKN